jgi:hypothetical protein
MLFGFVAVAIAEGIDESAFMESINHLYYDQRKALIEKRKDEKAKERRHQELCSAIRDSKTVIYR